MNAIIGNNVLVFQSRRLLGNLVEKMKLDIMKRIQTIVLIINETAETKY